MSKDGPSEDLFGHDDGESLLKKLCKYMRMYFRNHFADAVPDFQEILSTGSMVYRSSYKLELRSLMHTNYRE